MIVHPLATLTPTPTPLATPSLGEPSAHIVIQAAGTHLTLLQQLQGIDPMFWTVLGSAILLPIVHTAIQVAADWFNHTLSSTAKKLLLIVLASVVGFLANVQNSGVLSELHNPLLAAVLTAGISFFTGHNVYELFIKTNSELESLRDLPVNENPA